MIIFVDTVKTQRQKPQDVVAKDNIKNSIRFQYAMWFVCEIEGEIIIIDSDKFTVSAVPEKWIFFRNGKLYCHFPKTNIERKIKSQLTPIEGSQKWTIYPCRKLMNGDKFATYKAAKEAEKVATNYSTLTEYNDSLEKKTIQKRKNEDEPNDLNNKNIKTDIDSTFHDGELSDVEIIGNDSFEFNEKIKYGGAYCNNLTIPNDKKCSEYYSEPEEEYENSNELSDDPSDDNDNAINATNSDIKLPRNDQYEFLSENSCSDNLEFDENVESDFTFSQKSEENFGLRASRVLTSTLLEESESLQKNQKVLATITNVEEILSTFMNNMQQELHQLKENAKSNVQQSVDTLPLSPILGKVPSVKAPRIEVLNVQVLSGPINENLEFPNFEGQVSEIEIGQNEQVSSENLNDKLEVPNFQVPEIEKPIEENDITLLESLLPILRKEHFPVMDDLLKDETPKTPESFTPRQEFLIDYLLPIKGETEAKYMDRIIPMLFDTPFFLSSITWRIEADVNRVYIKESNILKCWKKSFETIFAADKNNTRLMYHCRRFKMKERAAVKNVKIKKQTKSTEN